MDWLKEGTTWEVVQEWRKRHPGYSDTKVSTQDMRAVLAGKKIIARCKKGFVVMTQEELDKRNAATERVNAVIRKTNAEARQRALEERAAFLRTEGGQQLAKDLADISRRYAGWTRPGRISWRPPAITKGGPKPIPETRPDVLKRMIEKMDAEGTYRQEFSNGEFTCSSLIISRTFEGAADRKYDLECAHDQAFFDEDKKLWWRQGGSFD